MLCLLLRVELRRFVELDDFAVDARAHEALAAQLLQHLRMFAFAFIDHRREQQQRRAFGQPQ